MTDRRSLYEKVKAVADDPRGDPATRAAAIARLAKLKPPTPFNQRNPGLQPSFDYERYTFMDLSNWSRTANGNRSHVVTHKGKTYRIVLFEYKQVPDYGWLRIGVGDPARDFSGRFHSLGEAHRDAWTSLMKL
jgi:hypothetical protein